ncbi:MAG: ribosome biogenesis GTPase Der [bacterium]
MSPKVDLVEHNLPLVAIVGRPNVGKSTLFNRICHKRKAVVHDTPGLTRDRNFETAEWEGRHFLVVDTGGYDLRPDDSMSEQIREQTLLAIEDADAIIFLTTVDDTLNPIDEDLMSLLRRSGKPVLLAINKCDNVKLKHEAVAFAKFGLEKLFPISSLHGLGVDNLLDDLLASLPTKGDQAGEEQAPGIRLAVVGRQNVGKSTLVNSILGEERVIANPQPGTTRDSIHTTFEREDRRYTIIDTAGIRRRGKIERGIEKLTVLSSLMSLERCDIALVLFDATAGITEQDAHVAGYAVERGRGIILIVNKWDAMEKETDTAGTFAKTLRHELAFLEFAPILFLSAKTGQRVHKIFDLVNEVYPEFTKQIETSEVNEALESFLRKNSPPVRHGRSLKIKYAVQTAIAPPTFTLFVNDTSLMHFSYRRYLTNKFRERFGFVGCPIRLRLRKK